MRLTRVKIKDKYNIKYVNLDLSDGCALVVGPNGCGKTNIIKCIAEAIKSIHRSSSRSYQKILKDKRPGDAFIDLSFNFSESERKIFLQLRMIAITSRVFLLCKFLKSKTDSPDSYKELQEKFTNESVPLLLKVLYSSCASLGQWRKERESPDVIVSHVEPPEGNPYFENGNYVLNVELPDKTVEETQIISDFFKKEFGEAVLGDKSGVVKRGSGKEENVPVEEIISDIVSHDKFSYLECSDDTSGNGNNLSDMYGQTSFGNYPYLIKELKGLQQHSNSSLHGIVMSFFRVGTACILPQNRGHSTDEKDDLCWNLVKCEESIVRAYLCEQGSEKFNQLNKIKEAMLFIAGLELDVCAYPSGKFEPIRRYIDDPPTREKGQLLILREFNTEQAEWRLLSKLSGGQRELLMVLSAIHLSTVDTVLLDEPGHSLHPPKQAQLRRWFESRRETNQVLIAITHSPDMISSHWLGALYHMFPDEDGYSAACLQKIPRKDGNDNWAADDFESSQTNLSRSHSEVVRQSSDEDGSLVGDCAAGSSYPDDNEVDGPPPKRRRISTESPPHATIEVGFDMIDFLMGMEMRRLFFSCGAVFVEGDTDRRTIQALRAVELEKVDTALRDPNLSIRLWNAAHKETQMDRWDIIPIYGSANWLKAYAAAEDLKIPFITVLDADVLNQKIGSKILPITSEDWKKSRLRNAVSNSKYGSDHPLKKMVEKVDKLVDVKSTGDKEIRVREEMEKCNLWVWSSGDLEDLFFMDKRVREKLVKNEQFMKIMKELQLHFPHQLTSGRSEMSDFFAQENFRQKCFSFFFDQVENVKKEFEITMEKLEEYPKNTEIVTELSNCPSLNRLIQVKQKLGNHVKFVAEGTKLKEKADETKSPEAAKQRFWQRVKTTLHDRGNWKRISFDLLKAMVEIAIDQEDHQLHKLWKCIKGRLISSDVSARIPAFLIQEKFLNTLKTDH